MNDRQAVRRLKQGDISGLEALVERYQLEAVRSAYLIIGDRAWAEDVAQTAFLRAYERIDQFDESRRFPPWFFQIVTNIALKTIRADARTVTLDDVMSAVLSDQPAGPEHAVTQSEMEEAILQALWQLPPEQRAVIVLRFYFGFTESDMATELEAPLGTIRWRMHTALKRLRGILLGGSAHG